MVGVQRLLAITLAFSLGALPVCGEPDVLGVVAQADGASLGSEAVAEGTTVFDGDQLTTGAGGSLRLLVGDALLYLAEQSTVVVHREDSGAATKFSAELGSGTTVLTLNAKVAGEIIARSASVRPLSETRGAVQLEIGGPRQLVVFAQRGPAQISYAGESEIIPEGKAYWVLLNPEEDPQSGQGNEKPPIKKRKALILIAIGLGAAGGVAAILKSMGGGRSAPAPTQGNVESPDHP